MLPVGQKRFQPGLIAASIALAFYLPSLPSAITGEDAGELTVATYFLGIPHPPGYPTWCLAAHPFTWLPIASVAWRVSLSSAVFSALAAGVTALIVFELTAVAWAGVVAGLVFASAAPVFAQAVIAEVYGLNALCFTSCVYFLVRWTREREARWLYALALFTGLGQGIHNTMSILAPIFAAYVAYVEPALLKNPRRIAAYIGVFLLGCCTYLYLPLRSLADPPVDWGNPETWENFLAHVRRDQFAFMYGQYPRSLARYAEQLSGMWRVILLLWGLALYIGPLAALALPVLCWRWPRQGMLIVLTGLLPVLVIFWLQNPLDTSEWRAVMIPFHIPAAWALAVALGAGLGTEFVPLATLRKIAASFCILGAVAAALLHSTWVSPVAQAAWVDSYARNLLNQLPENAILFAGPDHAAFPILYLQSVEGVRRDVALGNPYGYVDMALIADAPEDLRATLGARPRRGLDPEYYGWLLLNTARPVYFSEAPRLAEGVPVQFRQEGLLYRALKPGDAQDTTPVWPEGYAWPVTDQQMRDSYTRGFTARQIVAEYQLKRLTYDFEMGMKEYPTLRVSNLLSVAHGDPEYLNNTAILLAKHGYFREALPIFEAALACDPDNETVGANLDKLRVRMNEGR